MLDDKTLYTYNNIRHKNTKLSNYISSKYFSDIYVCFYKAMQLLKKNITLYKLSSSIYPLNKPMCCILDLDETFFQNDSFLYNTLGIWKYNPLLYDKFTELKFYNMNFGPILPFMFILYKYLIYKNIHIIFLSGRKEKYRNLTIDNLSYFNISPDSYDLILNDTNCISNKYKQDQLTIISQNYNIVLCMNDQNEFMHENLIKMPQLYTISS